MDNQFFHKYDLELLLGTNNIPLLVDPVIYEFAVETNSRFLVKI